VEGYKPLPIRTHYCYAVTLGTACGGGILPLAYKETAEAVHETEMSKIKCTSGCVNTTKKRLPNTFSVMGNRFFFFIALLIT